MKNTFKLSIKAVFLSLILSFLFTIKAEDQIKIVGSSTVFPISTFTGIIFSTILATKTTPIGIIVTIVATWTTVAKSSAQWNKNWPKAIPNTERKTIGRGSVLSGVIKFLELGINRLNSKSASPPNPNLHTDTSTPEMPDSFTKNSELAWPQTPRKADK